MIACLFLLLSVADPGLAVLEGRVVAEGEGGLVGARVFVEQGLSGNVWEGAVARDGTFRFENVRAGVTGVFAVAEGFAFGGRSVRVALSDYVSGIEIRLQRPEVLRGTVVDHRGKAIAGARITRVALLGKEKVGIPLSKLRAFGIREPSTDGSGRFSVEGLPGGTKLALKIAHGEYAQQGVMDLTAGDRNVRIVLHLGVLVTGTVFSRGQKSPVAGASIIVRNVEPPLDTSMTRSAGDGSFGLRLRPGLYMCKATGHAFTSRGWTELFVTGERPVEPLTLYVGGLGSIRGYVKDARTGEAVQGAKIVAEAGGAPVSITYTGPGGEFAFSVSRGEVIVQFNSAPGYLNPPSPFLRVQVAEGKVADIPTYWIAPIPAYRIRVVDGEGAPVPGAVVSIIRPAQFGWRVTDDKGEVALSFAALPNDGAVVGVVQHRRGREGAVFALSREDSSGAVVELLPLGRAGGVVRGSGGRPLPGVVVDGLFSTESVEGLLSLWRTVSGPDGRFVWDGIMPHIPQYCVASLKGTKVGETVASKPRSFILSSERAADLGALELSVKEGGKSMAGKKLRLRNMKVLCGSFESVQGKKSLPTVLIFCSGTEAPMVAEALENAASILAPTRIRFAVVTEGELECVDSSIAVLEGAAPGPASTYLLDEYGTVVMETFGMPPLFGLEALERRAGPGR